MMATDQFDPQSTRIRPITQAMDICCQSPGPFAQLSSHHQNAAQPAAATVAGVAQGPPDFTSTTVVAPTAVKAPRYAPETQSRAARYSSGMSDELLGSPWHGAAAASQQVGHFLFLGYLNRQVEFLPSFLHSFFAFMTLRSSTLSPALDTLFSSLLIYTLM